jgi:molybdopterin/thiamine biosynthesis adenylyltransferase
MKRAAARVLVVGVGGLGCPCALALARAGIGVLRLSDDDVVEESNLHRQILFDASSIGKPKLDEAKLALESIDAAPHVELSMRFLPHTAASLLAGCDLVVEGADNFATKFLVADACALARIPVVHGAAIGMHGSAFAVGAYGAPCYRCVFEDPPPGSSPNCAGAGVLGPMVGVVGALQADLALAMIDGRDVAGTVVTYDAASDVLRRTRISSRADCALCGPTCCIDDLDERRYIPTPLGVENGNHR